MKIEVDLNLVESSDWGEKVSELITDAIRTAIMKEISATLKKEKALIETKARAMIKTAMMEIEETQKEALAKKVSEIFKKEIVK